MPVTLATAPPAIAFSRNKIALGLLSDDYLAAPPAFAVNTLEFTAAIAVDQIIPLTWTGGAVQLTAKASPDNSGNQIPTGSGDNTYVTALAAVFQSNYLLDKFFVISVNTSGAHPKLVFTARAQTPDLNFSAYTLSGVNCANATPGVTGKPVVNFAHHIEVWVKNADGTQSLAYDANPALDFPQTGLTTVDLGDEVLQSFLKPDEPELSAAYAECTASIRPYFLKYAQYFGETPSVQKVTKTADFMAAFGGLGMQKQRDTDLVSMLNPVPGNATLNIFARLGSINKMTAKDQPEWLTYINTTAAAIVVDLEVTIVNDDETTFVFSPVTGLSIGAYKKYQFQTGYTQLNIAGQQSVDKTPVYYTVRLKNGTGDYITAAYAYVVDDAFYPWPRYFVYLNSMGAYQTIATVGKGQGQFAISKDTGQKAIGRDVAAITGGFLETNILIQDKTVVNIGYNRAGRRNTILLRDLMLSPKVYEYKNGRLIPVGISTTDLKDAMDGDNLYANSFEVYPLYQENVFSEADDVTDDSINDLLGDAGAPVPAPVDPPLADGGTIIVEFGDAHLSTVADQQVYTAPVWLTGRTNYRIQSTQLASFFRTEDVSYNATAGSFTILLPGFALSSGDQLIIFPFILNPDSL